MNSFEYKQCVLLETIVILLHCVLSFPKRNTASQGYSSWVYLCVCTCVSVCLVRFYQTVTNRLRKNYSLPQHCNCLVYNMFFSVNQHLYEATEFERQPYWCTCWPFCLASQAPDHISIHVTLLSTTWCFAIVFGVMLYSEAREI